MDKFSFIPLPDTIPAPWELFESLGLLTFILHILFMNAALGGLIIILVSRFRNPFSPSGDSLHGILVKKIPIAIPLAITFGVAPLLFLQVNYGHLFYSSSIFMSFYWILIIPLLMIAYYGAYVQSLHYEKSYPLSFIATLISTIILLYIAFIFSNNMTLMLQPERWKAYFQTPGGTILNLSDPQLLPRYLHMILGAVAVAGLFSAMAWSYGKKEDKAGEKVKKGLKIFAYVTWFQVMDGFWFLLSQPADILNLFIGGNRFYTAVLWIGVGLGLASIITALEGKLRLTTFVTVGTLIFMSVSRAFLRAAYVKRFFDINTLALHPQYTPMILFFLILLIGLVMIGFMLRVALGARQKGLTS